MENTNLYKENYNSYQTFLPLEFTVSYDKDIPADDISRTVKDIVERINVAKYVDFSNRDSHGYNGVLMLECVILAIAKEGYASLRKLDDLCKFEIRYKFIMQGQTPSFMAFHRFLKDDLTMPIEDIFYEINKLIEMDIGIDVEVLCIDGSKFEANANKMTFIWKKSTKKYYTKAWKKFIKLIERLNRYFKREKISLHYSTLRDPSIPYMLEVAKKIEQYMVMANIAFVHGKGKKKSEIQKIYDELVQIFLKIYKYTIYFDMLGDRNSCSKTDPDASFMHMKYDYYNHTNVFKPGYNVQFGTSDGFIRNIYISSDCNDLPTYIPFMEKYYQAYGKYPKKTPADAGYGSYDNYKYCRDKGIELYMKYAGYNKENEKTTKKNQFKIAHMRQEDGTYKCPGGHQFELIKETISKKGIYPKKIQTLENKHCEGCPLKSQCTKSKGNRIIKHSEDYEEMKQEVKTNLSSEEGKKLMNFRRIYSEGTFGIIKQDNEYDRLRRRGESAVRLEITLVAIGFNIRKYHKKLIEKRKKEQQNLAN